LQRERAARVALGLDIDGGQQEELFVRASSGAVILRLLDAPPPARSIPAGQPQEATQ
jgi:hypothetical protein